MTRIGFNLPSEVHGPDELIEYAARAEDAGFDFVVVSDHFHPWIREQGHSPFVWTVLGGIARETESIDVGTSVTCPTMRIHPAIVAQAAATTQDAFDGRFFLGVGTGERLNEHVLGDRWPPHHVRLEMLEEAVAVIRKLWSGEMGSHHGEHYTVENAQLFTLPEELPEIVVSGLGPRTASAAARFGEGLVSTSPTAEYVEHYQSAGGEGPRYGGALVSWAESESEARRNAHELWPTTALKGCGQELPTPHHFEQATENVSEEDVAETIPIGDDPEAYLDSIETYVDAGYDHVYLRQAGRNKEAFIEFAEREILPAVE